MPLTLSDLKLVGSQVQPDDDTTTDIGGAKATNRKPCFTDLSGLFQAVSSAAGDTTQTVTVHYLDTNGVPLSEVQTLTGQTPKTFGANIDRLLKALKSATTTGDVAVEAQTATRTGTAQAGAVNAITLDAGASAIDDAYHQMVIRITSGTGSGQIREIKKYVGSTKVATVNWPWGTMPDATSVFRISQGMMFDRQPNEVTEIRRVFYAAAAEAAGGSDKDLYDKLFYLNGSTGLALLNATVKELSDPSGLVTFGLATVINDTVTNGGGNTRLVAPAGITFDNADKVIPGSHLQSGSAIGVWLKLSLPAGTAAQKTQEVLSLTGSSA